MADVVFNPLLKRNIQYLGGGSDVDDKIAALQTLLNSLTKDSNGNYVISIPTKFLDDVTVEGTQTVVKTQEIQSENDYIILREGNPLGLAAGAYSGFKIKNYDGNSNNCLLVVDKNGWARIGDENGTIQKIATIEENPTNGQFVKYNTDTKQLESAPITVPNKVTAFFEPDGSDLQPNEIGEYQGTTNANFQEGCFYKRVIIHPVGESTLNVAEIHNYSKIESSEIVSNYFSVQSGTYYQQSGVTPSFEEYAMCRAVYKYADQNWNILFLTQSDDLSDIVVGDWIMINTSTQNNGVDVWDWHNVGTFYIAQISEITRNVVGNITSFKIVGGSNTLTFVDTYGWLYYNSNTLPFTIGNNNYTVYYSDNNKAGILLLPMSNNKYAPIVLAETIGAVETPVTDFIAIDTQQNGSNLIVDFTSDIVSGNIVSGESLAVICKKLMQLLTIKVAYSDWRKITQTRSSDYWSFYGIPQVAVNNVVKYGFETQNTSENQYYTGTVGLKNGVPFLIMVLENDIVPSVTLDMRLVVYYM